MSCDTCAVCALCHHCCVTCAVSPVSPCCVSIPAAALGLCRVPCPCDTCAVCALCHLCHLCPVSLCCVSIPAAACGSAGSLSLQLSRTMIQPWALWLCPGRAGTALSLPSPPCPGHSALLPPRFPSRCLGFLSAAFAVPGAQAGTADHSPGRALKCFSSTCSSWLQTCRRLCWIQSSAPLKFPPPG